MEENIKYRKLAEKNRMIYRVLYKWVTNLHDGKTLSHYLKKRGYNEIVIYGMGYLGDLLYEELIESDIKIVCVVDQEALNKGISEDISILLPTDDIPKADAMIVTTVSAYLEICRNISQKIEYPILSLEELIYEM